MPLQPVVDPMLPLVLLVQTVQNPLNLRVDLVDIALPVVALSILADTLL